MATYTWKVEIGEVVHEFTKRYQHDKATSLTRVRIWQKKLFFKIDLREMRRSWLKDGENTKRRPCVWKDRKIGLNEWGGDGINLGRKVGRAIMGRILDLSREEGQYYGKRMMQRRFTTRNMTNVYDNHSWGNIS